VARPLKAGRGVCGKGAQSGHYPTEEAAQAALYLIMQSPTRTERYPTRTYYCPMHDAWHLTSKPLRVPKPRRSSR
jgi:hypothetical protein